MTLFGSPCGRKGLGNSAQRLRIRFSAEGAIQDSLGQAKGRFSRRFAQP
jgi:hypothetical protein